MNAKQPFESVVAELGPTVLRVCRAVLGFDDADDAWSETFLSAMGAYPALPDDANIEAWLVTIAHRKAIDILRIQKRTATPMGDLPERVSVIGIPGVAETDVWERVKRLPDRQRQAIAYHFLASLPYAEVAAILGGSTDAARRAGADGMKKLRSTFADEAAGGETE